MKIEGILFGIFWKLESASSKSVSTVLNLQNFSVIQILLDLKFGKNHSFRASRFSKIDFTWNLNYKKSWNFHTV